VTTFLLEDAGDGWWHSPSPLRCEVLDGPAPKFGARAGARWPETYWLVRTEPAIQWDGDERFAARWGREHPLCFPIEPTSYALVMASSPWNGSIKLSGTAGIPAYPVSGVPTSVEESHPIEGLGIKAGIRPDQTTP
jgi:hypothetical protein